MNNVAHEISAGLFVVDDPDGEMVAEVSFRKWQSNPWHVLTMDNDNPVKRNFGFLKNALAFVDAEIPEPKE